MKKIRRIYRKKSEVKKNVKEIGRKIIKKEQMIKSDNRMFVLTLYLLHLMFTDTTSSPTLKALKNKL